MKIIRDEQRGFFDHGWLKTYHTFSFADYYDEDKMNFGLLRVFNDDVVDGHRGFDMHSHQNMEIITIPLFGALEHEDSTGQKGIIRPGDIQVMSAGRGIIHSEKNPLDTPGNFLQLWIFPDKRNVDPRYEQKNFNEPLQADKWQLLVSPDARNGSLWIYQNAFISRLKVEKKILVSFNRYNTSNGVFLFIIEGRTSHQKFTLNHRDSLLVNPDENIEMTVDPGSEILTIEVPMS